jgi:2-deoxy-D-gluconate 3-dehydrogenase
MILDDFKLDNKIALVTGCRTGLGQGISYGLAEAGADIIGVDYTEMEETKAYVEKLGRRFYGIQADLTKMESVSKIVEEGVNQFGQIVQ